MATGGVFKLITSDGKQDREIMKKSILNNQIREVAESEDSPRTKTKRIQELISESKKPLPVEKYPTMSESDSDDSSSDDDSSSVSDDEPQIPFVPIPEPAALKKPNPVITAALSKPVSVRTGNMEHAVYVKKNYFDKHGISAEVIEEATKGTEDIKDWEKDHDKLWVGLQRPDNKELAAAAKQDRPQDNWKITSVTTAPPPIASKDLQPAVEKIDVPRRKVIAKPMESATQTEETSSHQPHILSSSIIEPAPSPEVKNARDRLEKLRNEALLAEKELADAIAAEEENRRRINRRNAEETKRRHEQAVVSEAVDVLEATDCKFALAVGYLLTKKYASLDALITQTIRRNADIYNLQAIKSLIIQEAEIMKTDELFAEVSGDFLDEFHLEPKETGKMAKLYDTSIMDSYTAVDRKHKK